MWLIGRLATDFKTIADFRRDNAVSVPARMFSGSVASPIESIRITAATHVATPRTRPPCSRAIEPSLAQGSVPSGSRGGDRLRARLETRLA